MERVQQSVFGAVRAVVRCSSCEGSGQRIEKPCPDCRGEGRRRSEQKLKVEIPAGIDDGQSMRLSGEGMAGRRGGPSGDLYLRIQVRPDPRFERSGADLKTSLSVSVADAALGAKLPVDTIEGQVVLSVPAGTQPGTVLKLKGKGLPHLRSASHGDLFVTVTVKIPSKLDKKSKAAYQTLRELE
jgi:molecular chaperone DnaJ